MNRFRNFAPELPVQTKFRGVDRVGWLPLRRVAHNLVRLPKAHPRRLKRQNQHRLEQHAYDAGVLQSHEWCLPNWWPDQRRGRQSLRDDERD